MRCLPSRLNSMPKRDPEKGPTVKGTVNWLMGFLGSGLLAATMMMSVLGPPDFVLVLAKAKR
ncbi:MAG: hypothetical protein RIS92_3161 [Verrucomicrobiota bacterium]